MARSKYGTRGIKRLRRLTGWPVVAAMTRGGTYHRIDLVMEDGKVYILYPGHTARSPEFHRAAYALRAEDLEFERSFFYKTPVYGPCLPLDI